VFLKEHKVFFVKNKLKIMTIDIRIANLAVNLNCNILADEEGDICLLRKFYNDEGINIKKYNPYDCNYYSQERWLKAMETGDACRLMN
jgi:hypothetical protein